jgi:transmembrane sensor
MNNISRFANRAGVENEARLWLIRLDGEAPLDEQEAAALREWLGRSPAHRAELTRISRFWDNANILTELAVPLHRPRPQARRGTASPGLALFRRHAAGILTMAFVLVATCALMSWLLPQPRPASQGLYATAVGEQRSVTLADGSGVQLNTDSLIQVNYTDSLRKIRLLRGEAHFEVAPDPLKPFEVYADGSMVRAVGTAFSVRLMSDDVKVVVREGEVELVTVRAQPAGADSAHPPVRQEILASLRRGQSAVFGRTVGRVMQLDGEELARELSWRNGVLAFSGEPLSSVVAQINRYTNRTVEIADPELESVPVGGRFRIDELDEVFEVLQASPVPDR